MCLCFLSLMPLIAVSLPAGKVPLLIDPYLCRFDMRKIDRALNVLKGHVAAVMDVQFSPNGEELVSGKMTWSLTSFSMRFTANISGPSILRPYDKALEEGQGPLC